MNTIDTIRDDYLDGGGGIRTHGTLADTLVFKTRALNHSTTPPGVNNILNFFIITKGGCMFRRGSIRNLILNDIFY